MLGVSVASASRLACGPGAQFLALAFLVYVAFEQVGRRLPGRLRLSSILHSERKGGSTS